MAGPQAVWRPPPPSFLAGVHMFTAGCVGTISSHPIREGMGMVLGRGWGAVVGEPRSFPVINNIDASDGAH